MLLRLKGVLKMDDALGERAIFGDEARAFILEGADVDLLLGIDPTPCQQKAQI